MKLDKRLKDPVAAIRYALLLGQETPEDALEFLQAWDEGNLETLDEYDFDGSRDCVPERS